ncbi:MAG: phospholipid carrier-dependent glycosyltransferase [Candidatus Solibacter sp.]|nr:phospholipid carrier-dependent glycosyltransferase [Candidatus Solibacter sp.]
MSKNKARALPRTVPVPASAPAPGFWDSRILPFFEKWALAIALCCMAIACLRIAATWSQLGLTFDEPQHFACGLEYLAKHVYRYEPQHPPLARAMTAVLPYLDGARPTGNPDRENEGVGLLVRSANPDRFLTLMRAGILPFFLLACLVVFFWTRHIFGGPAASLATLLFTLLPPVLAHAGLATTDMALAACLGAAFFALVLWAEAPTWKRSVFLGLAGASAALSKFTALGYFPAGALLALLAWALVVRPGRAQLAQLVRVRAPALLLAAATGALTIWAAYYFSFGSITAGGASLPAPEFFDGIRTALRHNQEGHPSYLLGRNGTNGWWYYFPVALAVKTPIALLLLLALGVWLCVNRRARPGAWLPVAFALGILLPAMSSHVNIGVRHILPIYLGFSVIAAAGLIRVAQATPAGALALVLWLAISGALSHPDYLAYFNEFVGSEPEKVLVDSDLDWGQSTKPLARRLKELGATEVNFGVKNGRSAYLEVWPGLPKIKPIHPAIPAEGWTAVSPTIDKTTQYGLFFRYPNMQPWFDNLRPTERVGSYLLYYVPPGSLRKTP